MKILKYWLAQRPRIMAACAGGLTAGLSLLVFVLLIGLDQLNKLDQMQSTLAVKVQGLSLDTSNILRRLNQNDAPACDEASLRRLREEVALSIYQIDAGVLDERQRLRCSAVMGVLPRPMAPARPDAIVETAQGDRYALNFHLPLLIQDGAYRSTVARMGRFSTVISPHVMDDLFAVDEGMLYLGLPDGSYMQAYRNPELPGELAARLGRPEVLAAPLRGYSWTDRAFISSRAIDGTRYVSQFVVPLEDFVSAYERHLGLAWLFALLGGALLYGTLAPLLQRWGGLDHRIAGLLHPENILCMYQPIVDMRSGTPVGCEVLMRLRDGPQVLYPEQVLPLVAKAGLCWALDEAVVRRAIHELCDYLPADSDLKISFNFFPMNIDCNRLHGLISSQLARQPHRALRFDIEVIEQAEQSSLLVEVAGLKRAGYLISIDDFGTGYSNLASVRALAPDFLKIDKSFVFEMEDASVRSSLIPEIVGIARAVGAKVVAEGIENQAQHERLLAYGVDFGQGYLFARPMVIGEFERYLRGAPGSG